MQRHTIEQLKAIPIKGVLGWLGLEQVSKNHYKCPRHGGGSFVVYERTNSAYCFGECGRSFDVIDVVAEHRELDFLQAAQWLADFAKIDIEDMEQGRIYRKISPQKPVYASPKEIEPQLGVESRKQLWRKCLMSHMPDDVHKDWLASRGIESESLTTDVLFAFDREQYLKAMREQIKSKKASLEWLAFAGLLKPQWDTSDQTKKRAKDVEPFIWFEKGLIFRYACGTPRIRRITGNGPKVLSLPRVFECDNGAQLPFCHHHSIMLAKDQGKPLYIVGGELDVLSLMQLGRPAICPPGESVWRHIWSRDVMSASRVVILADRDLAGEKMAQRICKSIARLCGKSALKRVEAVTLDGADDPNDALQKGMLADALDHIERDLELV